MRIRWDGLAFGVRGIGDTVAGWTDGVYGAGMGFSVWAMKHTIPCSRNPSPISQNFIGRGDMESNSTCGCRRPIMDGSRVFNSQLSNQVYIYPTN